MAHHKRRRPKNRRAGCLMCKPWKANGCQSNALDGDCERFKPSEKRRLQKDKYDTENYGY